MHLLKSDVERLVSKFYNFFKISHIVLGKVARWYSKYYAKPMSGGRNTCLKDDLSRRVWLYVLD